MNAIEQAKEYLEEYGRCSYSPLETRKIIEGLLAEIAHLESFVSGEDLAP